jgi:phosphoglycolate phosphatase-like HAD superfamily hydrolase
MRLARTLAISVVIVVALAAPAQAAVVPVDPGPIAAGRPILGTTQNLPPLGSTGTYDSGPGFSDVITAYYESGAALKDQEAIAKRAQSWILGWIDRECGGKPKSCKAMVVFDIDETLLSAYALYSTATPPFSYNSAASNAFDESCSNTAIKPTIALYQRLKKAGVAIALVTGRDENLRSATEQCLRERGVTGWTALRLRLPAEQNLSAADYKFGVRTTFEKSGYRIVASIGDQVSDMSRGALIRGFLLPNAMYFIP